MQRRISRFCGRSMVLLTERFFTSFRMTYDELLVVRDFLRQVRRVRPLRQNDARPRNGLKVLRSYRSKKLLVFSFVILSLGERRQTQANTNPKTHPPKHLPCVRNVNYLLSSVISSNSALYTPLYQLPSPSLTCSKQPSISTILSWNSPPLASPSVSVSSI